VGRLHRGDDPGRREARDVRRVDDLEMLDPPAPVGAILLRQLLVDRNDLRVGGIADRVGRDLEARRRGVVCKRKQLGVRMKLQAT
jgi:hypothetical protein